MSRKFLGQVAGRDKEIAKYFVAAKEIRSFIPAQFAPLNKQYHTLTRRLPRSQTALGDTPMAATTGLCPLSDKIAFGYGLFLCWNFYVYTTKRAAILKQSARKLEPL
jgi:hypothetical protein